MSIISRYLIRQVVVNMLAVSLVLMLVFMSGRFIKYLAEAAAGGISADVLFLIMAYRMPEFLELILPLGLFIGILLSLGRMYLESEMSVLYACGVSRSRILGVILLVSLFTGMLVGWLSLYLGPVGLQKVQDIVYEQSRLTEFEMLVPGRFQNLRTGERVTYARSLSEDKKQLGQVFIAETPNNGSPPVIYVAKSGHLEFDEITQARYLVLDEGSLYRGGEKGLDYRTVEFNAYGIRIQPPEAQRLRQKDDAISSEALMESDTPKHWALLQWRVSLGLLVPIIAILAVSLSRVNPRQGRFFQLLPAMLIYISYLALLIVARKWVEKEKIPVWLGIWWVHGLVLLIALGLFYRDGMRAWLRGLREKA